MSERTEQDGRSKVKGADRLRAPYCVIDDAFDADFADALLAHLQSNETDFAPAGVLDREGDFFVDTGIRDAFKLPFEAGELAEKFRAELSQHLPALSEGSGLTLPPQVTLDIDAAAYRDGGQYEAHVDTLTHDARAAHGTDRLLSVIYYMKHAPDGFGGGELALYPIAGPQKPQLLAPRHNRLIAFPSFLRHEVRPVSCPENRFENARFSINCWVLRQHEPS